MAKPNHYSFKVFSTGSIGKPTGRVRNVPISSNVTPENPGYLVSTSLDRFSQMACTLEKLNTWNNHLMVFLGKEQCNSPQNYTTLTKLLFLYPFQVPQRQLRKGIRCTYAAIFHF